MKTSGCCSSARHLQARPSQLTWAKTAFTRPRSQRLPALQRLVGKLSEFLRCAGRARLTLRASCILTQRNVANFDPGRGLAARGLTVRRPS